MKSLRGKFLIASPHLSDPNFARTVILIVEHQLDGAFGVVLNRSAEGRIGDLLQGADLTSESTNSLLNDCRLLLGGPCDGQLLCLHGCTTCSEGEVIPGVFLATQTQNLSQIVQTADASFRMYWGYAGWGSGQLESELEMGGWLTSAASADMVFCKDLESLWRQAVTGSGQEILRESLKIKHFPVDAGLN